MDSTTLLIAFMRVVESIYIIAEQQPQLYPELEEILQDSLLLCFTADGANSADEALTCLSEIVYNGKNVSERAWNFYLHLINQYLQDDAHYEPAQAASLFIYIMVRAPNEFKNMNMNGQGTPLQLLFLFIGKVFENGQSNNHDYTSMCGISLIMAILEHLGERDPLVVENIHNINTMYIQEMSRAQNSDYKNMLIQGMMSNMWYDQQTTLASLKQTENLDQVFNFIFANMKNISKDFEIKRLVIGLASLTLQFDMPPPEELLPKSSDIMQAIVQMC